VIFPETVACTVVHTYGVPRLLEGEELRTALADLVRTYEAPRVQPWQFESLTEEYVEKMQRAIVGFEIEIIRLEGKFKLSQNRPEADRRGVIEQLSQSGDPLEAAVAERMR
jgi:transcriptional regulator